MDFCGDQISNHPDNREARVQQCSLSVPKSPFNLFYNYSLLFNIYQYLFLNICKELHYKLKSPDQLMFIENKKTLIFWCLVCSGESSIPVHAPFGKACRPPSQSLWTLGIGAVWTLRRKFLLFCSFYEENDTLYFITYFKIFNEHLGKSSRSLSKRRARSLGQRSIRPFP